MYKPFLFLAFLVFFSCGKTEETSQTEADILSQTEKTLYELVMEYRKEKNLPVIPLSKNLTIVAQTHVKDLVDNEPHKASEECNLHSWSDKGNWTPVCYTSDHAQASLLWSKPRELTTYQGNGYEILSYTMGINITPAKALELWKGSPPHHAVIINQGPWTKPWQAIGVGVYRGYAALWFGHEKDE